ncbi:MAG TPA: oxidoreductase, partial [Conexibacter sp.]|nr:oxidoreductase [Conexibacter sp.]
TVFPGFIRDAGMFANSGVRLPPGVGTRTPEDVAAGVVRAIERNKAEIDVAPLSMRAGTALNSVTPPDMGAALRRRMGAQRIADDLTAAQRTNR